MGKRGPAKQYPHKLEVQLDDEAWDFVTRMSEMTGASKPEIVRVAVRQGIQRLDDLVADAIEEGLLQLRTEESND
ncbi:ribbon-helix-helix protein, CopG family [Plantactinospora veratri]|uniref:Ribbon-helix-helix protein, CopG family n=1 Tax=Plantactinospora veratri TaxID=1436122 RepID=A0ABU7SM73_9ACTN